MNQTNEPRCECGEPKSAHNLLSLRPGTLRGPYLRPDGQVFCQKYREAT